MVEVLLSNDDITVLGPPETIELLTDIGPKGTRGSKVFVGTGNPNTLTTSGEIFSQTIELNDLYINASPGVNYGYMYQYISEPGGNTWVEILQLNPTIYSKNHTTQFSAGTGSNIGSASIVIPIDDIVTVSGTALTAANFNVQCSIAYTNPVAFSIQIPELVSPGDNLIINLEATEFSGGSWQALEEEVTTHIFISIVS